MDKNKELLVLVDDRLAEINNSIVTLSGRVDEIEKRIEELESEGDVEEFCEEMQVVVNSMTAMSPRMSKLFVHPRMLARLRWRPIRLRWRPTRLRWRLWKTNSRCA